MIWLYTTICLCIALGSAVVAFEALGAAGVILTAIAYVGALWGLHRAIEADMRGQGCG